LTWLACAAKARAVTGGEGCRKAARESSHASARRRSNRPRNLSGTKDRARLTVWKVSSVAKAMGTAEGAKLSGASDRRGRQPEALFSEHRRSHPLPERIE